MPPAELPKIVTREGSPAEGRDVALHPLEGGHHVEESVVGPGLARRRGLEQGVGEEAEGAEAVVEGDEHHAVASEGEAVARRSSEPVPERKPPPWIHTMTGRPGPPGTLSGVQTFRVRQSSVMGTGRLGLWAGGPEVDGVPHALPPRRGLRGTPPQRPHRWRRVGDAAEHANPRLSRAPHDAALGLDGHRERRRGRIALRQEDDSIARSTPTSRRRRGARRAVTWPSCRMPPFIAARPLPRAGGEIVLARLRRG